MASRTCEGPTLPDEQAEPALTATPARSNAMTWVSLGIVGMAIQAVLHSRGTRLPIRAPPRAQISVSSRSRKLAIRGTSARSSSAKAAARGPMPRSASESAASPPRPKSTTPSRRWSGSFPACAAKHNFILFPEASATRPAMLYMMPELWCSARRRKSSSCPK